MIKKLQSLDVRILYLIMVIFVTYPLVRPIGLPLVITDSVRATYERINDRVEAGDIVFIDVDFDPSSAPELLPQFMAMGKHLADRGAKIILFSMLPGWFMYQRTFQEIMEGEPWNLAYGEDIISLPYKAGNEAAYAAFGQDFKGLYTEDYWGQPLTGMPLWSRIQGPADAKLAIVYCAGDQAVWFIRQVGQVTGLEVMNGTVASSGAYMTPYWQSRQLTGFVVGMSGAAEYEVLAGHPGRAAAGMDGQSFGHMLITLFVILGNIGYFASKRAAERARGDD